MGIWQLMVLTAVLGGPAAPSEDGAAAVLVFREEAYVKGPQVLLGEIAEVEGAGGEALDHVEIISAARPGASKRLDAALVVARLKNAGYEGLDLEVKGAGVVHATTLHQEIAPETIAGDLREFIEQSMPWDPLVTEVEVEAPSQTLIAPEGEVKFKWRISPGYGYAGPGTFRGELTVDGAEVRTVTCRAEVDTYANVLVAVTTIPRGRLIMPGDIGLETRLLSSLREAAFQNPADLLGRYTAKTSIAPGEAITRSAVEPRVLVRRKQLVTVEMASGALHVQTQAEAQSDAAEGESVVCKNVNSKQPFVGVVRRDGVVVVQ